MIRKIFTILLAAMAAVGCSKSNIQPSGEHDSSSNAITFSTPDNWGETKGLVLGDETFTEMDVYAYYTAQDDWSAADNFPYFMHKQKVEKKGSAWSYAPIKYWPNNDGDKITFYALAPRDEVAVEEDATTGKPIFNYEASQFCGDNHDLSVDVIYNQEKDPAGVSFAMKHALAMVTLRAKITGKLNPDGAAFSHETYHVSAVTLNGLYKDAQMQIADDKSISWSIDKSETLPEISATQGVTLTDPQFIPDKNNTVTKTQLTTDYKSVMNTNQAMFVLPQELSTYRGDDAPTITISILRSYYASKEDATAKKLTQITYKTKPMVIPIPVENSTMVHGWEVGMHNRLSFTFDLDKLSEFDTPMTLVSEVRPWTEVDVDVNIHPNTYIYANANEFDLNGATTADMYIYTNYDYDLRVPRSKYELDGSVTTAHGFTFYPEDPATSIAPKILDNSGATIAFETKPDGVYANGTKLEYYNYTPNPELFQDKFFVLDDYYETKVPGPAILNKDGDVVEIKWLKCELNSSALANAVFYYVGLTTRSQLGLYNNTSVETGSAGVNKEGSDAVYILRLQVNNNNFTDGVFKGAIGAEMLSNGGGMMIYKNNVTVIK